MSSSRPRDQHDDDDVVSTPFILTAGAEIAQLVLLGLAVHSVAGFDPPLGTFSGRGDFSLGVNMGSNSIPPKKLFRMRV